MNRRLGALACIPLAWWLAGCGSGGDDALVGTEGVRECLVKARISGGQRPATGSQGVNVVPVYLDTAPDFTAYTATGIAVDVVVQGSADRAQQTATHARSALASLGGAAGASGRVIAQRNAVAVFARTPSGEARSAVRACLASG